MGEDPETPEGHVTPVQRRRFASTDDVIAAVRGGLLMRNPRITVTRDSSRQGGWHVEVWAAGGDGD